jgi:hypothetical protein
VAVTNGNMGEALREGIDAFFAHKYERHKMVLDKVYKQVTTKKSWAEFLSIAGFGVMSERALLAQTAHEDPAQGYLVQIRPVAYAKAYGIAEETLDDDINGVAKDFTNMLMESAAETENVLSHVPLNDGFTTLGYDGDALFSASHNRIGGGTYSNLITAADPSLLLLEDFHIAIADAQDDNGKQIRLKPTMYLVPTEMAWTAKELLGSSAKPGATNDAMNPAEGMVPWMSSPYLTDPDAMIMFTDCPSGFVCIKRKRPFLRHDNDESTLGMYTYLHMRLVFSYLNPRAAWGCAGA